MMTAQQLAGLMPDTRELLSDEPQMESTQHYQQLALLVSHLEWHWREQTDFFIGANLTVYYTHQQLHQRQFRGPDFFLVREVDPRPRTSWVVWNEQGRYPDLIIELLSDSTAEVDRIEKKRLYQNIFHTHEYFWFSPITGEFAGFRLTSHWCWGRRKRRCGSGNTPKRNGTGLNRQKGRPKRSGKRGKRLSNGPSAWRNGCGIWALI
jgi:Uma2 family endonuclease